MSFSLGSAVVVVARSEAAMSFGAGVSTGSLFFTAWTAAALFGGGLHSCATQLVHMSSKLKTDIYAILSKGQQAVPGELPTALEWVE